VSDNEEKKANKPQKHFDQLFIRTARSESLIAIFRSLSVAIVINRLIDFCETPDTMIMSSKLNNSPGLSLVGSENKTPRNKLKRLTEIHLNAIEKLKTERLSIPYYET